MTVPSLDYATRPTGCHPERNRFSGGAKDIEDAVTCLGVADILDRKYLR